eukprot:TRINITY_DN5295_c0_g1_i1.p1 TRINITY_DN5295_c0_g1~~TRINITY_DN5295_c0_g1_i1.p1  ORF type:complete len:962 (-),score=252.27 TRINITY_DN5295_c0_g1_i1:24-2909(-)
MSSNSSPQSTSSVGNSPTSVTTKEKSHNIFGRMAGKLKRKESVKDLSSLNPDAQNKDSSLYSSHSEPNVNINSSNSSNNPSPSSSYSHSRSAIGSSSAGITNGIQKTQRQSSISSSSEDEFENQKHPIEPSSSSSKQEERIKELEEENRKLKEKLSQKESITNSNCTQHLETIEKLQLEVEQLKSIIAEQSSNRQKEQRSLVKDPSQLISPRTVLSQSLEDQHLAPSTSEPPKARTISLNIESNGITLKTSVQNTWTVRETIVRVKRKIPGDTTNFHLLIRVVGSKNSYVVMENDKLIDSYKSLEEHVLEFDKLGNYEMKGKRLLKKTPSLKKDKISVKLFQTLITDKNYDKLEKLLLEDNRYDIEIPVHFAFKSGDAKIAQMFSDYYQRMNFDINTVDSNHATPLHHAASTAGTDKDDEVLNILLDHPQVKVDAVDDEGDTALHHFCKGYISPSCKEIGQKLINKVPPIVNLRNKNGEIPLHKAVFNPSVRTLMVKLLISNGTNVNIPNTIGGETALHYAVKLKRKDLVKILLHAGADPLVKDNQEAHTAFDLANSSGQTEISEMLKSAIDLKKWMTKYKIEEHLLAFLRQDLYLDAIAGIQAANEDKLLDTLSIESVGVRLSIKQAFSEARDEYGKKRFEARIQRATTSGNQILPSTNIEQVMRLKQGLSELRKTSSGSNEDDWLIKHSELELSKELGVGVSGKVFKGLYKDTKVAIKVFKTVDNKAIEEFQKEFHVMNAVRSPYLIQLFGTSVEPKICMVMEYCSRGNLQEILKNPGIQIGWDVAQTFVVQILLGVVALHSCSPQVLHRDLKSLNFLVTKDWSIKMCDFGLARFNTPENMESMSKMCGTYHYLAPEIFYGQVFTEKSDVFSVGVIMWEIVNRVIKKKYETPFHEFKIKIDFQVPYQVAEKGIRPTIPPDCPPFWKETIQRCLLKDPLLRPTSKELLEIIQKEFSIPTG